MELISLTTQMRKEGLGIDNLLTLTDHGAIFSWLHRGLIREGILKIQNVAEVIFPWVHSWVWKLRAIKFMEAKSYKIYGAR